MTRSNGRCAKAERLRLSFPQGRRKSTSLVAGRRMTDMVGPMVLDGTINVDGFETCATSRPWPPTDTRAAWRFR